MNIDANMIPDRIKEQIVVSKDLFGNNFVSDLRPSAICLWLPEISSAGTSIPS